MNRARPGPHPHPLTPDQLPDGEQWWSSCPNCYSPIQGGPMGLTEHRRTVHTHHDDPRTPITIHLDY